MKLLSVSNTKTRKGEKKGYMTFILHLAPGRLSGHNVCPGASAGCLMSCLNTAGRGRFDKIQAARIRKTKLFFSDRESFMVQLVEDIKAGIRKADRENMIPVFRLNGTSDIRWENVECQIDHDDIGTEFFPNVMSAFPNIQFYDYTKLSNRKNIPSNYQLTFSRSESNENKMGEAIAHGMNVAIVFNTKKNDDLPELYYSEFHGIPFSPPILDIVDGDDTDLRFLDPSPCIVGLRAKGDGKKDSSGFVVTV